MVLKRFFISLFSVLIMVVLIIALAWNIFPSWLSHKLSSKAKVTVLIGNIRLSPSSIRLDRIYIDNPPKSILKKALEIDKMSVDVSIKRFLNKNIVINQMK